MLIDPLRAARSQSLTKSRLRRPLVSSNRVDGSYIGMYQRPQHLNSCDQYPLGMPTSLAQASSTLSY